jgi:ribonuclease BN (tRNA processing enzyme)
VKITVLGGCGAWPTTDRACSGYLVEHEGFLLLIDPGYATLPQLLSHTTAERVDAVLISHGHPDHCADLNSLLRARALGDDPPPALPVHALPGAVDAVLALDKPRMLEDAYALREFTAGQRFDVGPFQVDSRALPHFVPNAGLRLTAGGRARRALPVDGAPGGRARGRGRRRAADPHPPVAGDRPGARPRRRPAFPPRRPRHRRARPGDRSGLTIELG